MTASASASAVPPDKLFPADLERRCEGSNIDLVWAFASRDCLAPLPLEPSLDPWPIALRVSIEPLVPSVAPGGTTRLAIVFRNLGAEPLSLTFGVRKTTAEERRNATVAASEHTATFSFFARDAKGRSTLQPRNSARFGSIVGPGDAAVKLRLLPGGRAQGDAVFTAVGFDPDKSYPNPDRSAKPEPLAPGVYRVEALRLPVLLGKPPSDAIGHAQITVTTP